MRNRFRSLRIAIITSALIAAIPVVVIPAVAQTSAYKPARTADGKPDLNGVWQALSTANWDLQAHPAAPGPVSSLAADFAIPPGPGVVEGNEIPYLPAALEQRKKNLENRFTATRSRKSNASSPVYRAPPTCLTRSRSFNRRKT